MDGTLGGRYRIQRELARGGFGVVYAGIDTALDRPVAIKQLHVQLNPDDLIRFRREALAVAQLQHPNIAGVREVGQDRGQWFMVMELVEGSSLQERLKFDGAWDQVEAASLVAEIAEAIEHAHQAGVLHRDLKPGNVLVTPSGQPKVVDFGLAKIRDLRGRLGNASAGGLAESLTLDGEILGTPAYMAPEQAEGAQVDARADVYALGGTLFALLTGQAPRTGSTPLAILTRLLEDPTPQPSSLRPDVDPALEAICLRAMAKEVDQRWPDMRAFARALQDWVQAQRSAREGARRLRGPTLVVIATLGLLLGGGLGVLLAQRRTPVESPLTGPASPTQGPPPSGVLPWSDNLPVPDSRNARYEALLQRARRSTAAGEFEQARLHLTQAITLAPEVGKAYFLRGLTHQQQASWQSAIADYRLAIACAPAPQGIAGIGRATMYLELASAHAGARDLPGALASCEAGLEAAPGDYLLLVRRGGLRSSTGDSVGGAADLEQASRIDPNRPEAWFALGSSAFRALHYRTAEALFTKALNASPGHRGSLFNRAIVREILKDYPGSLSDFERLVRAHPRDPLARLNHGRMLEQAGQKRAAAAEYEISLQLAPNQEHAATLRTKVRQFIGRDPLPAAKLKGRRAPE